MTGTIALPRSANGRRFERRSSAVKLLHKAALRLGAPIYWASANSVAPTNARDEGTFDEEADTLGNGKEPRNRRVAKWRSRLLTSVQLQERLKLLSELGLSDAEIAEAIPNAGSARSVRRWRLQGMNEARSAARWRPIDDLCAIVGYLLADGTYDERGAVAWLRSRHPELAQRRPLEALAAGDFASVLNAAEITLAAAILAGSQLAGPVTQAMATQDNWTSNVHDDKRRVAQQSSQ